MERKQRWQDWVVLVFAIWLFFSPFFLGYGADARAAWNAYVLGVLLAISSTWALAAPQKWEAWTDLLLGIWLVISPWVLRVGGDSVATANFVVLGLLVGAYALWAISRRSASTATREQLQR
jgi:hypothetical protein